VAVLLLIQWEQFPCSVKTYWALTFGLSIRWCDVLWPCLDLYASVP
jgi:hypothetical protein